VAGLLAVIADLFSEPSTEEGGSSGSPVPTPYSSVAARVTGGDALTPSGRDRLRRDLETSGAQEATAALSMLASLPVDCGAADLLEVVQVAYGFAEAPASRAPAATGGNPPQRTLRAVKPRPHTDGFYRDIDDGLDDDDIAAERKAQRQELAWLRRQRAAQEAVAGGGIAQLYSTCFKNAHLADDAAPDPVFQADLSDERLLGFRRFVKGRIDEIDRLPLSPVKRALRKAFLVLASSDAVPDPMLEAPDDLVAASSRFVEQSYSSNRVGLANLSCQKLAWGELAKQAKGAKDATVDIASLNECGGILGPSFAEYGELAAAEMSGASSIGLEMPLRVTCTVLATHAVECMEEGLAKAEVVSRERAARNANLLGHYKKMLEVIEDDVQVRKTWAYGADGIAICPYAAYRYFKICQILANFILLQHAHAGLSRNASFITLLNREALTALIRAALADRDAKPPKAPPTKPPPSGRSSGKGGKGSASGDKAAPKQRTWLSPWESGSESLISRRTAALERFKAGVQWGKLSKTNKSTVRAIALGDHTFAFLLRPDDPSDRVFKTLRDFRRAAKGWKIPSQHELAGAAQGAEQPLE
jgi:hypothetical protein